MQEPVTTQPHSINKKITLIYLLQKHSCRNAKKTILNFIHKIYSWNSEFLTIVSNLLELPSIIKFYFTKIKSTNTSLTAAGLHIK